VESKDQGILSTPVFSLLVQEHPFNEPTLHHIGVGVSVSDIKKNASNNTGSNPQVLVNGEVVHGNYKPKVDDVVHVTLVPADPISPWVVALIVVGSVALSIALMPSIGDQNTEGSDENKFDRISGLKNKTPLYEPFQALLGKRKIAPSYISRPYTTVEGDREYFHALFSAGYGPLKLENFRIGETSIEDFDDVEVVVLDHFENTDESVIREFWKQDINQELVQIELREEEGWTNRTTAPNPETIVSNFLFPSGVFSMDKKGNNEPQIVEVRQDIQDENGDWWTVVKPQRATSGTVLHPRDYAVSPYQGDFVVWKDSSILNKIYGLLDEGFVNANGERLSSLGNYEVINVDGLLFFKNLPENYKIGSLVYTDSTRKPKLKSIRIPRVPQIWGNQTSINIRTRKVGPTRERVEEARGSADVQWENLQTIRPLTDDGFKEAIGYNRPRLRYDGNVVRNFRPTVIGVRMRATGQLNGNLDNLYCDATMVVPSDKSTDWRDWPNLTLEPSNNPADAYKWLMQGGMNYSPIPNDKIDNNSLSTWRQRCIDENWTISALIDYQSTLLTELKNVSYVGRAEFQFNEGKFGVIEKIKQVVPRQIFTPKNSANFQSRRVYPEVVDGVKFTFESKDVDYEQDEGTFLDPAKALDQTLLKGRYTSVDLWGVDNFDQAYRLTRLDYYEQFLRREAYTLDLDAEVLASKRGDLVRVTNDIINVGLGAGRIKAINGNVITLDEQINTDQLPPNNFGVQVRDSKGVITTSPATYLGDGQFDCDTLDAEVLVGDLVIYGEVGKEAIDCIITSIKYNEDLGATLTLLNAANELYDFDGNPVPTYNPSIAIPTDTTQPPSPVMSVSTNRGVMSILVNSPDQSYPAKNYRAYIQARSFPLTATTPDEYFLDEDDGWEYIAQGDVAQFAFEVTTLDRGLKYEVRSQFRSPIGAVSGWSNNVIVELRAGEDLPEVENLNYVHNLDGTYLTYTPVQDPELAGYEIRTDLNFGVEDENFVGVTKDNSFFLGLLTTQQMYYVSSFNTFGEYGIGDSVDVLVNQPPIPNSFIAEQEGLTSRLRWSISNNGYAIDNYEVRVSKPPFTDVSDSIGIGSVDALTTTYSTTDVGTHYFFVKTIDVAGNESDYASTSVEVVFNSDTIRDELDNIEIGIDDINLDIIDIGSDIDDINLDITDIGSDIDDINLDISNITDSITAISGINRDIEFRLKTESERRQQSELELLQSEIQAAASREELARRVAAGESLIDAVVYVDPTNGQIVNRAFNYTDESFTNAQLLIDGVSGEVDIATQRIETVEGEVTNLSSELSLIPGQITATATSIVNESISALTPAHSFNFFDSAQGWVAVNGTIINGVNEVDVAFGDIENDSLNFDASENQLIRIGIERTSGSGWRGDVIIERDDTTTETYAGIIAEPSVGAVTVSADFRGISSYNGTINRVRLVLGNSVADEFTITSIIIGKPDSSLLELESVQARVSQAELDIDANEAAITQRVTVTEYNNNTVTFSNVETTVDGLNSIIDLQATRQELIDNDTIVKANTAGIEIDALGGTVTTLAQTVQSNQDDNTAQFIEANERIDAQNGEIVNNAYGIYTERSRNQESDIAALFAEIDIAKIRAGDLSTNTNFADAINKINVDIGPDGALAEQLTSLEAFTVINGNLITATNDRVDRVQTDVDGNTSAISGLSLRVGDTESDILATIKRVDQVEIDADNNSSAISGLQLLVNDLDAGLGGTLSRLDSVETVNGQQASAISQLDLRVTSNDGDINGALTRLSSVETVNNQQTSAIDALEIEVDDLDSGLSGALTRLSSVETVNGQQATVISGLQQRVTDVESDISSSLTRLDSVETINGQQATAISQLDLRVTNNDGDISGALTRLNDVETVNGQQTSAIDALEIEVNDLDSGLSGALSRIDSVEVVNGQQATAISGVQGKLDNPQTNSSALYGFVQTAQSTADGAASSVTQLTNRVEDNEDFAAAQVQLNTNFNQSIGELEARAFFGVNVNDQVTGIFVSGSNSQQQIEFKSDSVVFVDDDNTPMIYFDVENGRYVFDGEIIADSGTFSGNVSGATITASTITGGTISGASVSGGRVATTQSASASRAIMEDDGTYMFWIGKGAKNDANGTFWIKKDGTGYIKGSFFEGGVVESQSATGVYSASVNHKSAGKNVSITVGSSGSAFANTSSAPSGGVGTSTYLIDYTVKRGSSTLESGKINVTRDVRYEQGEYLTTDYYSFGTNLIDSNTSSTTYTYTIEVDQLNLSGRNQKCSISTFENILN